MVEFLEYQTIPLVNLTVVFMRSCDHATLSPLVFLLLQAGLIITEPPLDDMIRGRGLFDRGECN